MPYILKLSHRFRILHIPIINSESTSFHEESIAKNKTYLFHRESVAKNNLVYKLQNENNMFTTNF